LERVLHIGIAGVNNSWFGEGETRGAVKEWQTDRGVEKTGF
jgi:hypothetical protein